MCSFVQLRLCNCVCAPVRVRAPVCVPGGLLLSAIHLAHAGDGSLPPTPPLHLTATSVVQHTVLLPPKPHPSPKGCTRVRFPCHLVVQRGVGVWLVGMLPIVHVTGWLSSLPLSSTHVLVLVSSPAMPTPLHGPGLALSPLCAVRPVLAVPPSPHFGADTMRKCVWRLTPRQACARP